MMEKKKIGRFAGTTEGRILAERLAGTQIPLNIFVATEYGKEGLPTAENINVFCGRMDEAQIAEKIREQSFDLVIDATHPYAGLVSENVKIGRASCRERVYVLV